MPAVGQLQQPLAAVLRAAMLDDEALPDQLPEHPVEALLGDAQDAEQVADGHLRMAPDEVDHPVMRPAKAELRKDRVGLGGEIAIGEEQQLDAVAHLLLAQEPWLDAGHRR